MAKNKQNSGAQNRYIKKQKLLNAAANDQTQTKLCFNSSFQTSLLNYTNSSCSKDLNNKIPTDNISKKMSVY